MKKTRILAFLLAICLILPAFAVTGLANDAAVAETGPKGDANGDGIVDTRDVITMRKYIADLDYATGTSSVEIDPMADMNDDGEIRLYDLYLLRYFVVNGEYAPENDSTESKGDTDVTESETETEDKECNHAIVPHDSKAPTCTEIGWDAYFNCTRCDYTSYKEIPALGHTEVIDKAVAPTCTETGLAEGKHCSVCGEVLVAQKVVEALGHTAGDGATCTTAQSCTVCGEVLNPELGHTEVIDKAVAPTCTETGLTEGNHCSVCNTVLTNQEIVAVKPHTYDDKYDEKCNVCGFNRDVECLDYVVITLNDTLGTTKQFVVENGSEFNPYWEWNLPKRDGYVFVGWEYNGYLIENSISTNDKNIELKATWKTTNYHYQTILGTDTNSISNIKGYFNGYLGDCFSNSTSLGSSYYVYVSGAYKSIIYSGYCFYNQNSYYSTGGFIIKNVTTNEMLVDADDDECKINTNSSYSNRKDYSGTLEVAPGTLLLIYVYGFTNDPQAKYGYHGENMETGHVELCVGQARDSITISYSGEKTTHALLVDWIVDEVASCTNTGTRHKECIVCGFKTSSETYNDPSAHNYNTLWVMDESNHWHECLNCGYKKDLNSHKAFTVEENRVGVTCTEDGHYDIVNYCESCNAELSRKTVIVPAAHLPKSSIEENKVEATCTEDGYYDSVVYCSVCNEELSREATTIPASHNIKNGICAVCDCECFSSGLQFSRNYDDNWNPDGTCCVYGIGSCTDIDIYIPKISPQGDVVTSVKFILGGNWGTNPINITIPDSVTSIGDIAFEFCDNITSITIPNSVTSIGERAFYECTSLTGVAIPDSVTSIGMSAFSCCTSLKSVNFGENSKLKRINNAAFYKCTNLTSIIIPDSVTSIGHNVFGDCTSLTSVTIPDSVTSIGYDAFSGCTSLTIYCGAESQPSGWDSKWNSSNRPVVWGYIAPKPEPAPIIRYGRTTISGKAAEIYDILAEKVMCETPQTKIEFDISKQFTIGDLELARDMIMSDYPECFWWRGDFSCAVTSSGYIAYIEPQYAYSGDQLTSMRAELEEVVAEILAGLPSGSNFDKALYLHDEVAEIVTYTVTDNDQTPYGALVEREAVCNGYATSYQLLLQRAGITAWTVSGTANGGPHAWNVVWLEDGVCVYTDVTWDDQDVLRRYYFNMSLDEIDNDHFVSSNFVLPECGHTDYSYEDVSADAKVLYDTDGAAKCAEFFEEAANGTKVAKFFYMGTDFNAWLNANASTLSGLVGGTNFSYSRLGNEYVLTIS